MVDPTGIERAWRARGFSFGIWEDGPDVCWENVSHGRDELFMLAAGEMELTVDGRSLQLRPGEEILIPAGAARTKRCTGVDGMRWFFGYRRPE